MFEEERMNQQIPPQLEKVDLVPQDDQGINVAQVPLQNDHIPNVEEVMRCWQFIKN